MKFKSSTIVSLLFLLTILLSSFASAQKSNIWGVEKGDKLQWTTFDNYYAIQSYTNINNSLSITKNNVDNSMRYRIEYEIVKDWKSGDLTINISSIDVSTNVIQLNVTYLTISGSAIVSRNYTNYAREKIVTIIPSQINVFTSNVYNEPYTLQTEKDVDISLSGNAFIKNENDTFTIPDAIAYATAGIANITFYNSSGFQYGFSYLFHYVSSTERIVKEPLKSYESLGLSIEVMDIKDYENDEDDLDDLLIMSENTFSTSTPIGDYTIGTPRYFDISSITSLISIISFLTSMNGANGPSIPFGFSLPSGMNIIYSDVGNVIKSLIEISPSFVNDIINPLLSQTSPNLNGLLNEIRANGVTLSTFYNSLMLLSFTNFLIMPTGINMTKLGETFDTLSESISDIVPIIDNFDLSDIIYLLKNMFTYSYDGTYAKITINSSALPLIFDSRNGLASLEINMIWKENIFNKIEFEVNYINSGFGHDMGFKYKESQNDNQENENASWTNQLTRFILIFIGLISGGGLAIIIKKKRQHPVPFQSTINGMRNNSDCFNGYCPEK